MPRNPRQSKDAASAKARSKKASPENQAKSTGNKWQKGQSGNPKGRPKQDPELRDLARAYTTEALERLVEIMRTGGERAAVTACNVILDRGWGKAQQSMELTGKNGAPLVPILNVLHTNGRTSGQSQPAS
jgi:hypothetical protein